MCTTKAKFDYMTEANKAILVVRINNKKSVQESWTTWRGKDEFSLTTSDKSAKPIMQCFFFCYDIRHAEMSQQEKWQLWASFSREERSYFRIIPFLQYVGVGGDEPGGWWNETNKANLANAIDRRPNLSVQMTGLKWRWVLGKMNPDLTRCRKCLLWSRWTEICFIMMKSQCGRAQ